MQYKSTTCNTWSTVNTVFSSVAGEEAVCHAGPGVHSFKTTVSWVPTKKSNGAVNTGPLDVDSPE